MRNRKGFTLIELMIATVFVSLLVLIAIPQLNKVREKAYVAVMTTDLGNLKIQQESYFVDNMQYSSQLSDLPDYGMSSGVTLRLRGEASGWTAEARHDKTRIRCAVFVGREGGNRGRGRGRGGAGVNPFPPATEEGAVACDPRRGRGRGR